MPCICHLNGYELKDAAARKQLQQQQEQITQQQQQIDTALQEQQQQIDTALQEQQAQLNTQLQQQQAQITAQQQQQQATFNQAMQAQQEQMDTALRGFEEEAEQTQQEVNEALETLKNRSISVESWAQEVKSSDSAAWHECSGNVAAVFVNVATTSGECIISGIWTPATSGMKNFMYGILNPSGTSDVWATTVYIDGNKVSITRNGTATLKYFVTALLA
jgi:exonuclease VII large subunit